MSINNLINNNLGPIASNNLYLKHLNRDNLNLGHVNSQSICPNRNSTKIDELRNILSNLYLDVVGITETWLNDCILDTAVAINGYNIYRNDRIVRSAGGVCIYVSKKLKSKVVHKINDDGVCEAVFVEVLIKNSQKVLIGVIYLPRGNISLVDDLIGDLSSQYSNVIFMGDFNINLFSNSEIMRNFCTRFELSIVHNNLPTHFDSYHHSTSLIDYFLVSDSSLIKNKGQFQVPSLNSHHAFSFISCNLNVENISNDIYIRDFNSVNVEEICNNMLSKDFNSIYDMTDSNMQIEVINNHLINVFHENIPVKKINVGTDNRWMKAKVVLQAIELRNMALRGYFENRSDENWRIYCKYRNKAKSAIRKQRKLYAERFFSECSPKQLWNKLRSVGTLNTSNNNCTFNASDLNDQFVMHQIDRNVRLLHTGFIDTDINEGFSFKTVNENDIWSGIIRVRSNAIGADGVSIKFLKLIFHLVSRHLVHLFNTIITTSRFPDSWKVGRVIPVPKVKSPMTPGDFRPITVLSVFSKIFEIIINNQILEHLHTHSLISKFQSGFRKYHNTTTLTLEVTEKLRDNLNRKKDSVLIFLDFSKAFDSIVHPVLINKLFNLYSFLPSACNLLYSFLINRSQFVKLNNDISPMKTIYRGVPQGSTLGPLLFMLYINDIFSSLQFCEARIYADDVQLMAVNSFSSLDVFQNMIEQDLSSLVIWSQENFLTLNPNKTRAMLFSNRSIQLNLSIDLVPIVFVDHYKSLGFYIDNNLNFNYHISFMISRISFLLRRVYNVGLYLPLHVKKKIGYALFMSTFLYGLEIYAGTSIGNIIRLKKCFNRVIRYIYGLKYRDHVSSFVLNFVGTNFEDFIKLRSILLFYKIIKCNTPSYIVDLFTFANSSRSRMLECPLISTKVKENSFTVRVCRIWNYTLQSDNRRFNLSLNDFKKLILERL